MPQENDMLAYSFHPAHGPGRWRGARLAAAAEILAKIPLPARVVAGLAGAAAGERALKRVGASVNPKQPAPALAGTGSSRISATRRVWRGFGGSRLRGWLLARMDVCRYGWKLQPLGPERPVSRRSTRAPDYRGREASAGRGLRIPRGS